MAAVTCWRQVYFEYDVFTKANDICKAEDWTRSATGVSALPLATGADGVMIEYKQKCVYSKLTLLCWWRRG